MALSLLETFVEHEKNNKDFGFYWENLDQILDQIRSECDEIKDAYLKNDAEHIQEEVGDVINAAISLCVFLNLDLEETLQKNLQKFENRFNIMVELVKEVENPLLPTSFFAFTMSRMGLSLLMGRIFGRLLKIP